MRLHVANLDLALCQAVDELVGPLGGPHEARDGARVLELVADGLLITPLGAQLVDKDHVVALRNGQLVALWREGHLPHNVILRALVRRLGQKFVLALTLIVKHEHDAVRRAHR